MTPGETSSAVLHTVEAFLETHPSLETATIAWDPNHMVGENETVRMTHVTIDGERYLVVCKRVGGAPS